MAHADGCAMAVVGLSLVDLPLIVAPTFAHLSSRGDLDSEAPKF